MARITSYATLATGVQDYLGRTDLGVASGNLDYLCAEAEEEMNSRLRVRRMLTALTPTVSSAGVVTLPSDFGGWVRFTVNDGSSKWDLDLKAPEQIIETMPFVTETGVPKKLFQNGSTHKILPYTDGLYTFTALYYARIPQLTAAAGTNWVITNFPMAYLFGCLVAAAGIAKDDSPAFQARLDKWEKRFSRAIERIIAEDAKDYDARKYATVAPDTSLFSGATVSNIESDG